MSSCLSRSRILTWKDLLEGRQPSQPIAQADQPPLSIYYIVDLLYSYMPTGKLFGVVYNPHFNIYICCCCYPILSHVLIILEMRGGELDGSWTGSHDEDKYSRWAVERYRIRGYSLPLLSLTHLLTFSPSSANTVIFRKPEQSTPAHRWGGLLTAWRAGWDCPAAWRPLLPDLKTGFLANLRKQFSKIQKNSTQSY